MNSVKYYAKTGKSDLCRVRYISNKCVPISCKVSGKFYQTEKEGSYTHSCKCIWTEVPRKNTVWKLQKFSLTLFSQKFRENNGC